MKIEEFREQVNERVKFNAARLIEGQTLNEMLNLAADTMEDVYDQVKSGIKSEATQANAPTPYDAVTYPDGLFETYVVRTPLTMPNSWGSSVTQAELDANFVFFDVKNGVVTKVLSAKAKADPAKIVTWTATTFASGSQVLYDGKIWESNSSTTATDIPGISSKWVEKTGAGNDDVAIVLDSFLDLKNYSDKTNINTKGSVLGTLQNDNTVIDELRNFATVLNVPTGGKQKVYLKYLRLINALYNSRTSVLGIKADSTKVVIRSAQTVVGDTVVKEYIYDVSQYQYISISYDAREEFTGFFFNAEYQDAPTEDSVKKYIDQNNSVLKSFIGSKTNILAVTNETIQLNKTVNYKNTLEGDANRWVMKDVLVQGRTKMYLKYRPSVNADSTQFPAVVGVYTSGIGVNFVPSSGSYPPTVTEYILDVSKFDKISFTGYMLWQEFECYFFDESPTNIEDSVKKLIDKNFNIIQNRKIHLYDLGFRESNSADVNSEIFNNALLKMDEVYKDIILPEGNYKVNSINYRNRANIIGQGQNTVLQSTKAEPIFKLDSVHGKNRIEYKNLLLIGTSGNANQGGYIGDFIMNGNDIGTKAFEMNAMAYTLFERIYMTNFTDVCFDAKGVLLCDFNDVQFTRTPKGIVSTDLPPYYSNLVTFKNCRFRYLSNIAVDWNNGTGIHFLMCDLSAVGTSGNSATGMFKMAGASTESTVNGVNFTFDKCWGEQNKGGFLISDESVNGRSSIRDCNFGAVEITAIIQNNNRLLIDTSNVPNVTTRNNAKTIVLNSIVRGHTEEGSSIYTVLG